MYGLCDLVQLQRVHGTYAYRSHITVCVHRINSIRTTRKFTREEAQADHGEGGWDRWPMVPVVDRQMTYAVLRSQFLVSGIQVENVSYVASPNLRAGIYCGRVSARPLPMMKEKIS